MKRGTWTIIWIVALGIAVVYVWGALAQLGR